MLDSQAIEHLDIVPAERPTHSGGEYNSVRKNGQPQSLFDYIDYCQTPFGKRMLKKWILSPLMDIGRLN